MIPLKHFSPETDTKIDWPNMRPDSLMMLDKARDIAGVPFEITSTYRTSEHSVEVGGLAHDAHTENPCSAFDIAYPDHPTRTKIFCALYDAGFRRLGINEKNGHVHVDDSDTLPKPAIWIE